MNEPSVDGSEKDSVSVEPSGMQQLIEFIRVFLLIIPTRWPYTSLGLGIASGWS